MTKTVTMAAAAAGHAEGGTALNAFDNALLVAGIGNVNLIRVSSIVPPDVSFIELPKIKLGALVPTAYATITSDVPGETIHEMRVFAVDHTVERIGCAVAAIALLDEEDLA